MGLAIRCLNIRACHRRRESEWDFRTCDFRPRIQTVARPARILLVGDAGNVGEIGAPHETALVGVWRAGRTGLAGRFGNMSLCMLRRNFGELKKEMGVYLRRRPAGCGSEGPGYGEIEAQIPNIFGACSGKYELRIGSLIELDFKDKTHRSAPRLIPSVMVTPMA